MLQRTLVAHTLSSLVIQDHLLETGEVARPAPHVHFRSRAAYEAALERHGLRLSHFDEYRVPGSRQTKHVLVAQRVAEIR